MNEKIIQDLMNKSYKDIDRDNRIFSPGKFAELIAQECADLCDRFQARGVGMQPAECAGAIRAMFGVKE